MSLSPYLWLFILLAVLVLIACVFGGGRYKFVGLSLGSNRKILERDKQVDGSADSADPPGEMSVVDIEEMVNQSVNYTPLVNLPKRKTNYYRRTGLGTRQIGGLGARRVGGLTKRRPGRRKMDGPATGIVTPYSHRSDFPSEGEALCCSIIEEIYRKPFYCVRPDFLKNPETACNLEIDIYNDELKLGIEYNGQQHYVFPNKFHKTYKEFINQVRRDKYKVDTCDKNGVYLISVPYNVPKESLKEYITYYLPENMVKREEGREDAE